MGVGNRRLDHPPNNQQLTLMANIWTKENVRGFCFTWALPDGAWLETKPFAVTVNGKATTKTERNWFSFQQIKKILGEGEFARLYRKHGIFTGCWITV